MERISLIFTEIHVFCILREICVQDHQNETGLLNIAVSSFTEFFKSSKSTISEAEWM